MAPRKVISRLRGGLGNQLFCYAVARRLALVNDAELVVDDVTGFVRDVKYRRKYLLHNFQIPARKANARERLEPFERWRRGIKKILARRRPFLDRSYIEHEGFDFDPRVLRIRVGGTVYLDGLWLSDRYFTDAADVIRGDLRIVEPQDRDNRLTAGRIRATNAVALHVRWFDAPGDPNVLNVSADYYRDAVARMEREVDRPHYFLFSDYPDQARALLGLPDDRLTVISHNRGDESAHLDMWLMSQCRHFVVANSSFSWWGAWLSPSPDKIVIAPDLAARFADVADSRELLPADWIRV